MTLAKVRWSTYNEDSQEFLEILHHEITTTSSRAECKFLVKIMADVYQMKTVGVEDEVCMRIIRDKLLKLSGLDR